VTPKRGERAAPPAANGEWEVRFGTNSAAKGWDQLCIQVPENTRRVFDLLRMHPRSVPPTERHHRLKGQLAVGAHRGSALEQWQYEVTGGGRIWYLIDDASHTLWIQHAGPGHPKATD